MKKTILTKKTLKLSGGIWNIIHLFKQISSDEAKEKNVMDQDTKGIDDRDED